MYVDDHAEWICHQAFDRRGGAVANPGTARGSGTVSNKDIDAVKNLEGVTDYVKRQNATVDFINTKLSRVHQTNP